MDGNPWPNESIGGNPGKRLNRNSFEAQGHIAVLVIMGAGAQKDILGNDNLAPDGNLGEVIKIRASSNCHDIADGKVPWHENTDALTDQDTGTDLRTPEAKKHHLQPAEWPRQNPENWLAKILPNESSQERPYAPLVH
jgi:hypothetical protein